ncbi:MAG: RNA polymerase factor sigma-54 [Bacteroidota bacterium]|nr:RNA polymerase factor sigma-54 [Bacteroidota bacterium]
MTEQFEAIVSSDKEEIIGLQIIGSLDDDGYLRRDLPAISNDLVFTQNVECNINELEAVLKKIQSLDPAGIAARSLQECLLLQLKRKDVKDLDVKMAVLIIEKHIDDFTKKHYDRLCKQLKIEEPQLKRAIEVIIHLNPKPGDISVADKSNYIIPDFTVTNEGNKLLVQLNNRNVPPLRVSRSYIDTIKSYEKNPNNKQLKDSMQYVKQKIDGARWFIESIKQRHNTLMLTMNAIVEFQRDFFFEGDERSLRPMILKDIATKVSLDISTISRVASSKYVDTEFGIFPLKFFFSEGMTNEDGEEVSNKEIKKILTECIAAEDKRKPLPDEILMEILKKKGYGIARRTVAKYREQLNIPVARLRREL